MSHVVSLVNVWLGGVVCCRVHLAVDGAGFDWPGWLVIEMSKTTTITIGGVSGLDANLLEDQFNVDSFIIHARTTSSLQALQKSLGSTLGCRPLF